MGPAALDDGGAAAPPLPGESRDKIREWGIAQITPGRHPAEWKEPSQEGALRCVALVGCTGVTALMHV